MNKRKQAIVDQWTRHVLRKHTVPRLAVLVSMIVGLIVCRPVVAQGGETLQYEYDLMQRLTRVTHADGTTIDYVYDALGNRLIKTTTLPGGSSNQPPAAVTNPNIANGLTNVPTTASLSWSPAVDPNSGDSVVYFIYFGTSPTPPLVFSGWATNWSPGKLKPVTTYYWQVQARDAHNAQAISALWTFTTGSDLPEARFSLTPSSGLAPLTVRFEDESTSVLGEIVAWEWDFDGNGSLDSTDRHPAFVYSSPGDYTVSLTVVDAEGVRGTAVNTNAVSVLGPNILDLRPLNLTVEDGTASDEVVVHYATTNQGTVSLSGRWQWTDVLYVSANAVLDESATSIAAFEEMQQLPAHSSYSRVRVVNIPVEARAKRYLILRTDDGDKLPEISETNNWLALPLHPPGDADSDGIPDSWERAFFGTVAACDPTEDRDRDGMTNAQEYVADTDPTNPESLLRLKRVVRESDGLRVDWEGGTNATLFVERNGDPALATNGWSVVQTVAPPTAAKTIVLDLAADSAVSFYRLRAERP